jgi:hypothetical protein
MKRKLLGVTYAEFDNTVGPKLLYSYPDHVMSKERFEDLSDYVIVGKHLCKKIIIVKNNEIQYMNYSMAIDNPKYERNALLFSVGFVLPVDVDTEPFESILRKLAAVLLALENEREFLFIDSSKAQIHGVLQRLYTDVSTKGETFIPLDENNVLAAKVFESPQPPLEIPDYRVPVIRFSRVAQINIPWDISLNYVLSRIDGVSHVKKIAAKRPAIDIECVRRCLRALLFYDCIVISDIVQLSNIYALQRQHQRPLSMSPDINHSDGSLRSCTDLGGNIFGTPSDPTGSKLMQEIFEFSSTTAGNCRIDSPGGGGGQDGHASRGKVGDDRARQVADVTKLLLKFRAGKQLGQVLLSSGVDALVGLDLRRLLAIAQDKGLLRRLHEYPVYICRPPDGSHNGHSAGPEYDTNNRSGTAGTGGTRPMPSSLHGAHDLVATSASGDGEFGAVDGGRSSTAGRGQGGTEVGVTHADQSLGGSDHTGVVRNIDITSARFLAQHFDGNRCLDALCCEYGLSSADILDKPDVFLVVYR